MKGRLLTDFGEVLPVEVHTRRIGLSLMIQGVFIKESPLESTNGLHIYFGK